MNKYNVMEYDDNYEAAINNLERIGYFDNDGDGKLAEIESSPHLQSQLATFGEVGDFIRDAELPDNELGNF